MTVHQQVSGEVCDDPRCRHSLIHLPGKRAAEHRARVAAFLELSSPEDLPLAAVPSYDRRIGNLPEKRRRWFRDHLNRQISLSVERSSEVVDDPHGSPDPPESQPTETQQAALTQACGTCRGYCCSLGGDRAWVDVAAMRSYLLNHPGIRPRALLEQYLDRLPQRTCRDSCVYHTFSGCVLPRSMRARICNTYYCTGLRELWTQLADPESLRALVIAMNGHRVVRSSVFVRGAAKPTPEDRPLERAPHVSILPLEGKCQKDKTAKQRLDT